MPRTRDAIVRAKEPTVLDLTLARPATIHGLVWDPDAEAALEGVEVRLLDGDGKFVSSLHTDAEGLFRFEGLRPRTYVVAIEVPTGFVIADPTHVVTVGPKEIAEVSFELRPGGVVRGKVVDEHTGEPLPDIEILLLDSQGQTLRRARTASGGEYEFVNLPEDRYQVVIADEGAST